MSRRTRTTTWPLEFATPQAKIEAALEQGHKGLSSDTPVAEHPVDIPLVHADRRDAD